MPDRPPLRILVVEDEPVNRALLRAVLGTAARLGPIDLVEASTVAEGRSRIGEARPDVVILDVRLPDGSGLELAREIDAAGTTPRPRILVMSASVLPRDREVALAAGSDGFLGKPFLPRDLIRLLEDLTGGHDAGSPLPGPAAGKQPG